MKKETDFEKVNNLVKMAKRMKWKISSCVIEMPPEAFNTFFPGLVYSEDEEYFIEGVKCVVKKDKCLISIKNCER